ncbi:MAG: hypothetical protein V4501_09050 [Pseudomonadota bacterium]
MSHKSRTNSVNTPDDSDSHYDDSRPTKTQKDLDYKAFQAFMVQYETLIPELVDSSYLLADRISALKELLKQNSELLAAATNPHFIPKEMVATARPIEEVKAILTNSDELLNDILFNLQPRSKFQYR